MQINIPIKELRQIVETHGWTLYRMPISEAISFEEIEKRKPVEEASIGHNCIFAPIPQNGQTLREAYSLTKGLGPSLLIDLNWQGLEDVFKGTGTCEMENEILFSRIWFANERVTVLISPITRDLTDPSAASIKMPYLLETFQKYFRIVRPEDYGRAVPISMPFHLEDN